MTISGGGTRAGTMGWRALEYLKNVPYKYLAEDSTPIESNLADQIDCISGISGGSFAATGWCIYKDSMDLFRERFINHNIQLSIFGGLFWPPSHLKALLSPYYNRIDIAAEYYDKYIFKSNQFKDLPSYPTLWINATNLSTADRFVFTPEQFGMMDSDIWCYPLGYACAASSAFPILLSPITIRNYGDVLPDSILEQNDEYSMAKLNSVRNPEKYFYCKTVQFFNDKRNKWIHLADGGLVDNQGLQAVLDQFNNNGVINKGLNDRKIKKLVIINVNAGTSSTDESSRHHGAPGIFGVINYTMTASMDILSAKRWNEIRSKCDDIWKAKLDGVGALELKPFCIEINFRNIQNDDFREECMNLPTSFHLTKPQIAVIDSAVPELFDENEDMTRFRPVTSSK
jgi:NTE family protein